MRRILQRGDEIDMDSREIEKRKLALDDCMHVTEDGVEFWYAREVMSVFGYTQWRNFEVAINRARVSLETTETPDEEHFAGVSKSIDMPKGGTREVQDYMLTRYACYLIAQNGDPRKEEIAFAQSYFALQTRKQELIEQRMLELRRLTERDALTESEKVLAAIAFERGVDQRGFAIIKSRGDEVLFGGHSTKAMKKRLGVSDKKPLADVLPDVTIAAKNLANSMTSHNVESKDLHGTGPIGNEHLQNNRSVRDTLVTRGIRPEDLPPEEDTKKLKRRVAADERKLKQDTIGFKPVKPE